MLRQYGILPRWLARLPGVEQSTLEGRSARGCPRWNWAWGVENKTSDAQLAAGQQSESAIDVFKKDPIGS